MSFLAVVFAFVFSFTVNVGQTLPITQGFALKQAENALNTINFRVRRADGSPIPAAFRVLSRWGGVASDASKPIKFVLVDFTSAGAGAYSLDDSGAAVMQGFALTAADNGASVTVNSGTAKAVIPKTGTQIVSSYKINEIEQLAAPWPSLSAQLPARARLTRLNTTTGAVGSPVGANQIRVNLPGVFTVNQQIRFEWKVRFAGYGEGYIKSLNYDGNSGYDGSFAGYSGKRFVFDRGGRNIVLSNYHSLFDGGTKYIARAEPRGVDGVPDDLQVGVSIEDYEAILEPPKTIVAINGDVLTLDSPLVYQQAVNCEVVPVSVNSPPTAVFTAESAVIHEQNALRVIVKQTGTLKLGAATPYPNLTVCFWHYFYAGQPFARVRLHLINRTGDINASVNEAVWDELRIGFPLARSATNSDDAVWVNAGPNSASARVLAQETVSTAIAGAFKVSVPEFPEMFPARLKAQGSLVEYAPYPLTTAAHAFPRDRARVWEVFIGERADVAASYLPTQALVTLDAEYLARSKAFRHTMLPKRKWNSGHFSGDTALAEAANRFERMAGCAYDLSQCDPASELGDQARMDMLAWKTSDHAQTQVMNQRGRHYGSDAFGMSQDSGDGWTHNRYDETWVYLYEWLRSGDARAFALGSAHARFSATFGMVQSAKSRNGNTAVNLEGLSWYEGGTSPLVQRDIPKPTHSWDEGVWLYWALTGDPIAEQGALKRRDAARRWNYNGVGYGAGTLGSGLDYNEARGNGWAAYNLIAAYRYFGDSYDLTRAKQYLDNLRLSEEAFGTLGVYAANIEGRDYTALTSTGTQPFIWAGYPSVALREYLMTKRYEGAPDTALESFAVRVAKWAVRGSAALTTPGANRPLRGGVTQPDGKYLPWGSVYAWYPASSTADGDIQTARANLLANTVSLGAWLSGESSLKTVAAGIFKDVCFYRDFPEGALNPLARSPITKRNTMFNGSALKLDNQTYQALNGWLWDALGASVLPETPPVIASVNTLYPANVVQGSPAIVLIVGGLNFRSDSKVLWNGIELPTQYGSPIQMFASVRAELLTTIGAKAITVRNPDGLSAPKVFQVTVPAANAPRIVFAYAWSAPAATSSARLIVIAENLGEGAAIILNGQNVGGSLANAGTIAAPIPAGVSGAVPVRVQASDGTLSNEVRIVIPLGAGVILKPPRTGGTGSVPTRGN